MNLIVPIIRKIPILQRGDVNVVRDVDHHDYVVRRQFAGACENFQRTQ